MIVEHDATDLAGRGKSKHADWFFMRASSYCSNARLSTLIVRQTP